MKLGDCFDELPEYYALGPAEIGLIVCALSYCSRHETHLVPKAWVRRRFGRQGTRAAARLLFDGIWSDDSPTAYRVLHDPREA